MVWSGVHRKRCRGIGMLYFDPTLIEAMARGRLSRTEQLIKLDMRDYHMSVSEREAICAVSH